VDIELVVFDAAGKSVEAVKAEQADIGFLPSTRYGVMASRLPRPMC